jgi:protein-disulfide isomerase
MAKTISDEKKTTSNEYVTLNFNGLSLPWAILLGVMIFTAGIGSAVYFGLKARPAGTTDSGVTPTTAPTYAATEFVEVTIPFTGGPTAGKESADVVVLEFSDLVCPYCKKFHDDSYGTIYDKYIKTGKVRFVYKHYPLSFHNPAATLSAKAAYCVEDLYGDDKMFEFNDMFFANSNTVTQNAYDDDNNPLVNIKDTAFNAMLTKMGVDATKVRNCMNTSEAATRVSNDEKELTAFQADLIEKQLSQGLGTPSFVIGVIKNGVLTGRLIEGAYPLVAFQNVIEEQLKK